MTTGGDDTTVEHHTFCRVCNAMCGLIVRTRGDDIVSVRGDDDHPLSRGYSCEKGRALGALHTASHRLDRPAMRAPDRSAPLEPASWDDTLDDLAARVDATIDEHGPDAVAMYLASGSAFDAAGRRSAERFLRLIGSQQKYTATTIDTPCRPFVAETLGGWSGLTPIWDEETCEVLVLVGSNPVVSHGHSNAMPDPVRRLRDARRRGCRIVVIDPRRTETAELADLHIAPRPGTDWLLLAACVARLAERSIAADVDGVDELLARVGPIDTTTICRLTDLDRATVEEFVTIVTSTPRLAVLTGTGTTMGRRAVTTEHLAWSIVALAGAFERPGGMWFNPGLLGRLDERDLPIGDGTAGTGPSSRPDLPRRFGEWPCVGLLDEIEAGNVRALFVVGGNPALALPDTDRTTRLLASLDVLAVLDIVPTETTASATHVLPALDPLERADVTWLLDGYQSAVAGQYTERVVAPRADRRGAWWTFAQLARRLGHDLHGADPDDLDERELLAPLLERSTIGAETMRAAGTAVVASGPRRGWIRERVLPEGRWRLGHPLLIAELDVAVAELVAEPSTTSVPDPHDALLIPHRRRSMMNSQFPDLGGPGERVAVRVAPSRAASLGVDGTEVRVTTANGTVVGVLRADVRLRDDTVTISHGSPECNVSVLTSGHADIDPSTGMVLQSGVPCRVDVA